MRIQGRTRYRPPVLGYCTKNTTASRIVYKIPEGKTMSSYSSKDDVVQDSKIKSSQYIKDKMYKSLTRIKRLVEDHDLLSLVFFVRSVTDEWASGFIDLPVIINTGDLTKLRLCYFTGISQENYFNTGLYGPLPVLNTPFISLVYTTFIDGPDVQQAMKNRYYVLVCIIYHREHGHITLGKEDLLFPLKQYFSMYKSVYEVIEEDNLRKLKDTILMIFQ
ncbi:MAG: hypothetical protein ACFFD4_24985 [Candidatus Odinarchaeota archaeon]